MTIKTIFAQTNCSNMNKSIQWYTSLFGRAPDARPMDGLAEWHHAQTAGLQLFLDPAKAGNQTVTIIVSGLQSHHDRLLADGMEPGSLERGDTVAFVRLSDPDGNLVVFAEPHPTEASTA
ncbi:MAG: VOC family protein [Pseudomonadota bacterium]